MDTNVIDRPAEYPDRLGVYRVGDLKFYSKLQAIEMHAKTGIHPYWDFNEAAFSCYDWTQEPQESLLELYRQRAQQLRDKYDYIVLFYSSGADSRNALDAFIHNDIKLDEVASYVNYEATAEKESRLNKEIFYQAIPHIKELQTKCPWIKHRLIDLSESQVKYFNSKEATFDWIYNMNTMFNANGPGMTSLGTRFKEWRTIIDQGKKLCLLWGIEKPRLFHENNKFFCKFLDLIDSGPTVKSMSGELPYSDEAFYWTPDLPKMIIKQVHVIKNYLNKFSLSSPYVSTTKTDLAYKTVEGTKLWLNNDGLHSLIYPTYNLGSISAAKPPSVIFSSRDIWFRNMEQSNRALHVWKMGLDKLWKTVPDYWKNDPTDMSLGLKGCWSKSYYLE